MTIIQLEIHILVFVPNVIYLFPFSVQQAPICTHRPDKSLLQRRPAGVGGHPSDL